MGSKLPPIKAQNNPEMAQIGSFMHDSNQTTINRLIDQSLIFQLLKSQPKMQNNKMAVREMRVKDEALET